MAGPPGPLVRSEPFIPPPTTTTVQADKLSSIDRNIKQLTMLIKGVVTEEVNHKALTASRDKSAFARLPLLFGRVKIPEPVPVSSPDLDARNEFIRVINPIVKNFDDMNESTKTLSTENPEKCMENILELESSLQELQGELLQSQRELEHQGIAKDAIGSVLNSKLSEVSYLLKQASITKQNLQFELNVVSRQRYFGLVPNSDASVSKSGFVNHTYDSCDYRIPNQFIRDLKGINIQIDGRKHATYDTFIEHLHKKDIPSVVIERVMKLAVQATIAEADVIVRGIIHDKYNAHEEDPDKHKLASFSKLNIDITTEGNKIPSLIFTFLFNAKSIETEELTGKGKLVLTIDDILNSDPEAPDATSVIAFMD